ncbi:MAG: carboxypeptidase regulatory-like domain-containing protein [Acidobacteria bacterium]|nr:carboxypeptidase regulatory-like domain-containing protein [Acidobacteriota bacterium]
MSPTRGERIFNVSAPSEAGGAGKPGGAVRWAVPLLALLVWTGTVFGAMAGLGASIRGQVRDEAGNALAGVRVRLAHAGKGVVRQTLTDEKGHFLFGNLFLESYVLSAELDGYNAVSRAGLVPTGEGELRVDIVLRPEEGGDGNPSPAAAGRGRNEGRGSSGLSADKGQP